MNIIQRFWYRQLKQPFVLSYDIRRGKGETVVLLHGIASEKGLWQPLVTLLEQAGNTVINLDLLGHGNSPKPDWVEYNTDDHAYSVIKTLRKLGAKKDLILVGHSMGSLVAARVAGMRPKIAKKLILYEPPIFADQADFPKHLKRRKLYFNIFERLAADPKDTVILTKLLGFVATNWADVRKNDDTWLPVQRSLRNSIMRQSIYYDLLNISIPTVIIHGRLDFIVTQKDIKRMYQDNPNITFYKTTVNHGLNAMSARFLAGMVAANYKPKKDVNK